MQSKKAILFWFYKEVEVCKNRLDLLKKHNPDIQIFGLFGGNIDEFESYQEILGHYFDDLYCFTKTSDPDWKWIHGDLVILDWYEHRGKSLNWDHIAIVQWDALLFDNINFLFKDIRPEEIVLSGHRILDSKLEQVWDWTRSDKEKRKNYLEFLEYVKEKYGYAGPTYCCLFIFQILNKTFFEKYLEVENKELGMLEYKVPIYAKIFNIPIHEYELGVRWHDNTNVAMNAIPKEIPATYIKEELTKPTGYRIFHPYFKIW